jgi:hypothetical protein
MSAPDPLWGLFVAIFSQLRDRLKGRVPPDEIAKTARAVLDNMRVQDGVVSWETADPITIIDARWNERVGRPARLVGHLAQLDDTRQGLVEHPNGDTEFVETTTIKIVGPDAETLEALPVVGRALVEKLHDAHRLGTLAEFLGIMVVVPVTPTSGKFMLHVVDVRPSTSAFDLLGATADERAQARELLDELRARSETPLSYLHALLVENLGIVALQDAPHLGDGIEFAVMQSLSTGLVGNAPARLHGLVVGPPGHGKKLYGLAARVLNPVCREGSAVKISAAGLVGASHRGADGWRSTPGLLPLASQGVLVVQDAHAWNGQKVGQIGPILQELMEDGEVRDSVAGGQKRRAETALLIDLNRHAQTAVGKTVAGEAPILGLLPFLSRLDTILEIPVAPERAWDVGEEMLRSLRQGGQALDRQPWVREARLLVALLRDEHREIDTARVEHEMRQVHRHFREECRELMTKNPVEASAIPVRLSINLMRFVLASARASDRSQATSEDVARAARFVATKLNVIRGARVAVSEWHGARRAGDENFWDRRAGQEVSPTETATAYETETGESASVRTIQRELKRRGAQNVAHGRWLLPPSNGGAS